MHSKDTPDQKVAVKLYSKSQENDGDARHFSQECYFLQKLSHPHIVKMIDCKNTGKYDDEFGDSHEVRYSVLELAENGNLLDFVMNKPMNESLVRFYFQQLLEASWYMHD